MPKDVDEIVVGANGSIWTSAVGVAVPEDESEAPGVGWLDLGFASEDGVTLTDAKTLENIPVWQLFYPARRIITERDFNLAFSLRQWSKLTVPLAFGGGTITEPDPGHFKYEPPTPEDIDERALMVDWIDGTKKYRLILPRGLVTENVESKLTRAAAADLPITFGVIGDETELPWYLLTNDPSFDTP